MALEVSAETATELLNGTLFMVLGTALPAVSSSLLRSKEVSDHRNKVLGTISDLLFVVRV